MNTPIHRPGYDALWNYFGLTRASWLTLPRVMMHDMPDEWQGKMAALMGEWDETWTNMPNMGVSVRATHYGKLIPMPKELINYRHPDTGYLNHMKR